MNRDDCKHYQGNGGCAGDACANCDGNPHPDLRDDDCNDDDWRREIAMQAGMAGGCDAYNEVMEWDVEVSR